LLKLTDLSYPLNVYALLLTKDTGSATHLHYGHFSSPDDSIQKAQARAVKLLRSQLPAQGKILEVGCGLGYLTNDLVEAGYNVTGLNADAVQCEIARSRYGVDLPVKCLELEEFSEDEGTWDFLLFHESSRSIPMLSLFARASSLLKVAGHILILDEFTCRRTDAGLEHLHHKDYFLAHAARFGFSCEKESDCSTAVVPMLNYLNRSLKKYRSELAETTGTDPVSVDELIALNARYKEKYSSAHFGYFLLDLKKEKPLQRRLAKIGPEDQPAVNLLFETVFGQSMSPRMWHWKYGPGRGHAIGLWEGDSLIAHYGGIPRQLSVAGVPIMASQSCDAMVAPHARGAFVRKGPFFQVCATYVENFVGYGTNHPLSFGFANERSFRLPHRLGVYTDPVTRILELSWSASFFRSHLWTMRTIDPSRSDDASLINVLWHRMACELEPLVVGVRNAAYLSDRYQNHPQYKYGLYLVYHRWLRKPLAVVVVKKDGDRLELLDWVAGIESIPRIVRAARLLAARSGMQEAYTIASLPVSKYLSKTFPEEKDTNIAVPSNAWTNAPDSEILQDKLWLTGGDTDYH